MTICQISLNEDGLRRACQELRAENERLRMGIRVTLDLLSDGPRGQRRLSAIRLLQDLLET